MWPFRKKTVAVAEDDQPEIVFDPFLGDAEARRLSRLLGERDWPAARAIIDNADPAAYGFYVGIASSKQGLPEWIDDAIRTDPDPVLPLLVKGLMAISWAWEARGSGYANTVSEEAWKVTRQRLTLAENCLDEVVDRDPKNVEALAGLLTLANARSKGLDELTRRYEAVIAVDPVHTDAHWAMLQALCRKWHGSSELMFAFAREKAAAHPGTALPGLVAAAYLEEWLDNDRDYDYMEGAGIGDEIAAAAHASILHPDFRPDPETPRLWNTFAMALSMSDRLTEAEYCFTRIGDTLVTRHPWSYMGKPGPKYLKWRSWTHTTLNP
ncbi:hypothetical protein CS0771_22120 [Catellatospora sp. IY07-71]|uniref:hypothetical protein n=1 Tax=Catellatospora sp. IY07-71 TaxID=2728827 RepID=UPI001BB384A1|nr:hypothetical protein [Catellatospora sp. IY07-71]BCJ72668.1 hypothetical protein CS0771_22120 [Catellatospora sp. IY07-71]